MLSADLSSQHVSPNWGLHWAYARFLDDLYPTFCEYHLHWANVWRKPSEGHFQCFTARKLQAMSTVKNSLISPPVQALPYFGGHVILDTNACNVQISCFLLQKPRDDTTKLIACWLSSFPGTSQRYDTTQLKCLAVFWSVLLSRPYLKGHRFKIRADHEAL